MTLLIVVSVVAALLAICAYQIVIHKYYWGPKGAPQKDAARKKDKP